MAQQQRLDIRMNQQLVMTPQLRMAIQLLQMNALDLQSFVDQELLENPYLSNEDGSNEAPADQGNDDVESRESDLTQDFASDSMPDDINADMGWDNMYDSGRGASQAAPLNGEDETSWESFATADQSLRDHLQTQLGLSTNDPVERFIGHYLIDAIDDAGYLELDFAKASQQLGVSAEKIEDVLLLLQTFDPTGVGARSLAECLELQLKAENTYTPVAAAILANLELLARRELGKLARLARCETEEIQQVVDRILTLTPKPGLKFGRDVSATVVPDLIVSRSPEGEWQVELNAEAMPRVLLNKDTVPGARTDSDRNFMSEKMNRAQWLLKSLEQRAKTIYKVGRAILQFQADFFTYGVESLQPLTLKQVADAIGSHESTVSRVTNGKYIQTPLGVFELKYFFSSAINTTGGASEVAAESVKAIIKRLIKGEDEKRPYSDEQLVKMLKREGVDVARRTVAKYREALNIPSSSQRRVRL